MAGLLEQVCMMIFTNRARTGVKRLDTFAYLFVLPANVAPPFTSQNVEPSVLVCTVKEVTQKLFELLPCVTTPYTSISDPASIVIHEPSHKLFPVRQCSAESSIDRAFPDPIALL